LNLPGLSTFKHCHLRAPQISHNRKDVLVSGSSMRNHRDCLGKRYFRQAMEDFPGRVLIAQQRLTRENDT
jgi:hypothetical protein